MVDLLQANWRYWPQWVLGHPPRQGYHSGGQFHGVVAIWLGPGMHGVVIVLVTAIAIAVDDGDGGDEARIHYTVNVLN